jgi:dGTPase
VFFAPQNDHICTRIEHVLHVSTIAATLCKGLNGRGFDLDPELAEAIGLGHDVGHAPFAHTGEEILSSLADSEGGFHHELHSLRVVDKVCNGGNGLNLTYGVRDGILFHCGERFEQCLYPREELLVLEEVEKDLWARTFPITWEGCIVRMSDRIAYLGRDVEDAVEAKIIEEKTIPSAVRANLGTRNGEIIDTFVADIIATSTPDKGIALSNRTYELMKELFRFNHRTIYNHERLLEYRAYSHRILHEIFDFLSALETNPDRLRHPHLRLEEVYSHFRTRYSPVHDEEQTGVVRRIIDFMAGMTDQFALESMREICLPKPL